MKPFNFIRFYFFQFSLATIILCFVPPLDAQEKQKTHMPLYEGKWCGRATIENINRLGGWGGGFLGFHVTTKDVWWFYFDIKFVHPLDDPSVIEEYKKMNIPVEIIKNIPIPLKGLNIIGYTTLTGFSEYSHETKEYCEECQGEDKTTKKDLPSIVIPISGNLNLEENKINFWFSDVPKEYDGLSYWFQPDNIKIVGHNKVLFDYKFFEGPEPGSVDQKFTGELYKIELLNKIFPKDIRPDEPIQTDKKTRIEIILPEESKVNIAENTIATLKSTSLLKVVLGKVHAIIKDIKPNTKFEVYTPTAVIGIRGTEYEIIVNDDGATTVRVFDGEVEFSDLDKKKTVLVKKNQESTIGRNKLATDSVPINEKFILKWWE